MSTNRILWSRWSALLVPLVISGCGGCGKSNRPSLDAGGPVDAGPADAGHPDAGHPDAGHRTDGGHHEPTDGGGCGLRTCLSAGAECGPIGDGCGALIQCGDCPFPQTCGGGGYSSVCGGTGACLPLSCADAGATCGPLGDGCGGLLNCGDCMGDATCGGGGIPYQCGVSTLVDGGRLEPDGGCLPLNCGDLQATCGPAGDGCGHVLTCGTCPTTETCGGGGVPSQCGTPTVTCQTRTCSDLHATCGYIGDGCGGSNQCGTCPSGSSCGAGGVPNQCGSLDAGSGCTGLCLKQVTCGDGGTTSISGTVFAATNPDAGYGLPDPLPNALVYIPNGTVDPFPEAVSCDVCGTPASGAPLVTATTFLDGGFILKDVPVGSDIPLVIQMGRWRRQITVPSVAACQDTPLPAEQTRMPRDHTEGDIPHVAMVTGVVDTIECVLRKMGIDDQEFGEPDSGSRVDFFEAPDIFGGYGATGPGDGGHITDMERLVSNPALLNTYDLVIFACVGSEVLQLPADQQNVINYTSNGGRLYATHFSYVWLFNDPPFDGTAVWDAGADTGGDNGPDPSTVDDLGLSGWLSGVGAASAPGQISMSDNRNDFVSATPPSETWLTDLTTGWPLHYTFNTPVGAAAGTQCGRVVFSDFHVENAQVSDQPFPTECTVGPMTPQEKVLEYMLFDLANCVTQTSPVVPGCVPATCASQGFTCGAQGDGCGNLIDGGCGACASPAACGGGGVPGVCGELGCEPETCASQGLSCGPAGDGCGNLIDGGCGSCVAPLTCGGGGQPGACGEGVECVPTTCLAQDLACGQGGDGCGHTLDCGSCTPPQTCGGGGVYGQCGMSPCVPQTCSTLGYQCGAGGDGCGGTVSCGECDGGTCGGGGQANVCGKFELE